MNAAHGVLANDIDPIAGDTLHVSAVNGQATNVGHAIAGHYGSLTLNPDGSYTYTAASSAVLPTGGVGQDVFTYTASTGPGSTADTTLTVNVSATGTTYISAAPGTTLTAPSGGHAPVLDGGAGNDVVVASNGATVLIGGPGDTLTGGKGSDTYVFTGQFGQNTITNYNPNKDLIELDHSHFKSFGDVQAATHQVGANTVITEDTSNSVTLVGVNMSSTTLRRQPFRVGISARRLHQTGAVICRTDTAPLNPFTFRSPASSDPAKAGCTISKDRSIIRLAVLNGGRSRGEKPDACRSSNKPTRVHRCARGRSGVAGRGQCIRCRITSDRIPLRDKFQRTIDAVLLGDVPRRTRVVGLLRRAKSEN